MVNRVQPRHDFLSESVHVQIALSDTLLKLPEPVVHVVILEDILFFQVPHDIVTFQSPFNLFYNQHPQIEKGPYCHTDPNHCRHWNLILHSFPIRIRHSRKVRVDLVVEEDMANSSNNCGMPELPSPIFRFQRCSDEKGSPLLWDTRNCNQSHES